MPHVSPPPDPIGWITGTVAPSSPLETLRTENVCTVVTSLIASCPIAEPTNAASALRNSCVEVRGVQLHAPHGEAVRATTGPASRTTIDRRATARSTRRRYSTVTDFAR